MMRPSQIALTTFYWAFIVYLFLPLALMVVMGFKDSNFIGFPINAWTTRWYVQVFQDTAVLHAFGYTLLIAIASTLLSLVIGIWCAVFLGPARFWGRALVFAVMCLPAVIPGVISAISMRIFIRAIGMEPGTGAIILGLTIHNVPFVALMVLSRLGAMPRSQVEAARDLGADSLVAFLRVTLPFLFPSLLGASIFCMLLSFDDFVRAFFLGGYQPTLPVLIFAELRSGMSPAINAISTVVLVVTAALGLWAERGTRRLKGTRR
ncbi:MAG TPA: ABC transporter permease [Geminicoccus sp.]|uniref:ABC transporter permease n=1 Tax=Geminicoccus sp. TaxID=2024832 RepID=UPI002BE23CF2|nr:ABC transporter permease [Geminicoccus sp.]HWL69884.1 ABC transporter permease [Geminicoccus sp.]